MGNPIRPFLMHIASAHQACCENKIIHAPLWYLLSHLCSLPCTLACKAAVKPQRKAQSAKQNVDNVPSRIYDIFTSCTQQTVSNFEIQWCCKSLAIKPFRITQTVRFEFNKKHKTLQRLYISGNRQTSRENLSPSFFPLIFTYSLYLFAQLRRFTSKLPNFLCPAKRLYIIEGPLPMFGHQSAHTHAKNMALHHTLRSHFGALSHLQLRRITANQAPNTAWVFPKPCGNQQLHLPLETAPQLQTQHKF